FEMLADDEVLPYHNVTSYAITDEAPFSPPALRQAAEAVVRRQEVLRTSFDLTTYAEPLQLVHRRARPHVAVDDLRGLPADEQRAEIERAVARERATRFDLESPPLWRLRAHRVSEHAWWLSMVECHAILDGWSHNSLLTELLATYRELRDAGDAAVVSGVVDVSGRSDTTRTPETATHHPTVRFADFVAAEREVLGSAEHREFWERRLAGRPASALPAHWGEAVAGARMTTRQIDVRELEPELRRLAAAARAPLKSVFLAGYLTALRAAVAGPCPMVGLIGNGRLETPGGDEVYGMFLNTLPYTLDSPEGSWAGLVADAFAEETAVWAHRRYPLPALQRLAGAGTPLIENTFNYLDFYTVDQQAVDLRQTADDSPNEFPLVVTVVPGQIQFTVRESRVSTGHADRLGALYRAVLTAMAADPDGPVEWHQPDLPTPEPCTAPPGPLAVIAGHVPLAPTAPSHPAAPSHPVAPPAPAALSGPVAPAALAMRLGDVPAVRSRAELESAIGSVWADVLDRDRVAPDEDFTALGGHSLTAMRISAKLRAEHQIAVSPRTVLRLRTVAGLAAALAEDAGPGADSTVVWLRRSGSRTPLICLHPGGGGVHWYRELTDALPDDQPVAAIQHPAATDPQHASLTVEQLAERYLAELRGVVGSGAYQLLGWCGGAPVTWELGRRLADAGVPARMLLLDPALESMACSEDAEPEQLRLLRRCEQLLEQLREDPGTPRDEIVGLLRLVVDDDRAHAMISADGLGEGWLDAVRVWRQLSESRLGYRFGPQSGGVDLILGDELAAGEHVALGEQDFEGYLAQWRRLTTGPVRLHRIPGSHVGVLRPPQVSELARVVTDIVMTDIVTPGREVTGAT
ncbi:MAG: condensation domain-containing protein, partial [Micromonosporaceae bacterium]